MSMTKELAQYINTLLAEKQREVKSKQDYLDKIDGLERHFTEYQEIECLYVVLFYQKNLF